MNPLQKAARWALEKAVGFPPWPNAGYGSVSFNTTDHWAGSVLGLSSSTSAGVSVTGMSALQCSGVWAAVGLRSRIMGHLPAFVYRRTKSGVQILTDHDLFDLLHDSPNALMTAMEWREAMMVNFDLFGNAFAEKATLGGRVAALNQLRSDRMTVKLDNGELRYEYQGDKGQKKTYGPDEILHIRNFSMDGIIGLNPIQQQREVIGLAMAQQSYGGALYRNGGRPAGVLEHPKTLTPEVRKRLREEWEQVHSGADNAGKVAILWEGMKYNAIGLSPQDAEYVAARGFQLADIARIYGLPPHLIGDLSRSTNNNIEHQGIEAVTYMIAPLCVRWEQRIKKSLLNRPGKDSGVYLKFNVAALMRGDASARAAFYSTMVQNGIMSRDECRELEELDRRGGSADELTVQSNMLDLNKLAKLGAPTAALDAGAM